MTVRSYGHMKIDLPQSCCSQRRFFRKPEPWIILYRKGDIFPPTKRPDCCVPCPPVPGFALVVMAVVTTACIPQTREWVTWPPPSSLPRTASHWTFTTPRLRAPTQGAYWVTKNGRSSWPSTPTKTSTWRKTKHVWRDKQAFVSRIGNLLS